MAYGWIGGIAWPVLMALTLGRLFPLIFQPRATRGIAIAVFLTLVGHALNALVIDMDHWRHNFLLIGLAWGLIGPGIGPPRRQPPRPRIRHSLRPGARGQSGPGVNQR